METRRVCLLKLFEVLIQTTSCAARASGHRINASLHFKKTKPDHSALPFPGVAHRCKAFLAEETFAFRNESLKSHAAERNSIVLLTLKIEQWTSTRVTHLGYKNIVGTLCLDVSKMLKCPVFLIDRFHDRE